MKLDTQSAKALLPARVLSVVPDIIDEADLRRVNRDTKTTIVDLGNLTNLRKFMKTHAEAKKSGKSSMKYSGDGWSGTKTWDGYEDLLENGDENVMKKIKVETGLKVKELSKKYEEVIHNYRFDVSGQFFDVGLVLTGVPESWLDPEVEPEEVLRVDIVINGAFNAGVDANKIVTASSRLLAMTKILEDNGVQVSLKMVNNNVAYNYDCERSLLSVITLKDYSEPINYRKLSAIMSPAHHRRGLFKIMEASCDKINGGYGSPRPLKGMIELGDRRAIDKLEHRLFGKGK